MYALQRTKACVNPWLRSAGNLGSASRCSPNGRGSIMARCDVATATQAARRGESEAETARCRLECGQAYPAGGAHKKILKPARQRQLVHQVRTKFQVSVRPACGLLGAH